MGNIREPIKKCSIEKKERIIKKGFELMCEKGYHNVNTVDIAKYSNVSNTYDSYVFSGAGSAFSNDWYNDNNLKYLTTYAYAHDYEGQIAYNRSRLGDATGEVILNASATWYVQEATFAYSSKPWFGRSGNCEDSTHAGIFSFNNILYGMSAGPYTSRAVLVSLK